MAERHKSYRTRRGEPAESPTFSIDDQTFTCRARMPGTRLLEWDQLLDAATAGVTATVILEYFEEALGPDEYKRFRAFTDDPDNEVELQLLGEVWRDLVRAYSGRPTERSSDSGTGPPTTTDTSTES